MKPDRYCFLGFPVSLAVAKQMADRLIFTDHDAPIGAQSVVRRRTQYAVPVRRAA